MKRNMRKGFSLIEMVIVILILGIIAAVAAPRMFDTATTAEENTTRQQLAVLRNAIEMYRAQNGNYPAVLDTAMATMLNGPFPAPSIKPIRDLAAIYYDTDPDAAVAVVPLPSATEGWAYKAVNGSLKLNILTPSKGFDW